MSALTSVPGDPDVAPTSNHQAGCWHSRAICLTALHAVLTTIVQKERGQKQELSRLQLPETHVASMIRALRLEGMSNAASSNSTCSEPSGQTSISHHHKWLLL